jgi:hypothetical protein
MTIICIFFTGCQTTHPKTPAGESTQEQLDAVGSVTGALTGKELTDAEKRKMLRDLKSDKEAQSAMKSISGALEVRQTGIKFCPVDGQRFSSDVDLCPTHHVKLKELTD